MTKLFINILGYNASGKTTLAKKLASDLDINRINGDDFRTFIKQNIAYFNNLDITYKNPVFDTLNPLVISYRLQMTELLLGNNQSVIYEGSGVKKEWREKYLSIARQYNAKTILILCEISEDELLDRLANREDGERWKNQYFDSRKGTLEEPEENEVDLILHYTQDNYDEVLQKLASL
jgi:predicted kinase